MVRNLGQGGYILDQSFMLLNEDEVLIDIGKCLIDDVE
jgi:hypothetical protein